MPKPYTPDEIKQMYDTVSTTKPNELFSNFVSLVQTNEREAVLMFAVHTAVRMSQLTDNIKGPNDIIKKATDLLKDASLLEDVRGFKHNR